ncbi:MAG: bifunctional metallophosphatase/5'-nucleotidase [Magnetococcales bacterium]|nr:bifunctional metallophosphatase/5'-nucleotidase [Magnetococcales bacterium]MBF0156090.1 bifunctional metallophosphatase/5'-nucleotidase [Magnetococcales bacterium]
MCDSLPSLVLRLLLMLPLSLSVAFADAEAVGPPAITFLHVCDVYNISPVSGKGGFSRLATLLEEERQKDPEAVFVLPGDFLSPSLMTPLFQGRQMVEMLNLTGLDIASPGNHEFDRGLESLDRNVAASRFLWLASNLKRNGKDYPGMKSREIRTVRGVKVGFFSVLDPEFAELVRLPAEATITDPVAVARAEVAAMRREGVQVVVALTHLDLEDERRLAVQAPGIDLILAGHDHVVIKEKVGETLLVESGLELEVLGRITLHPGTPGRLEDVEFLPVVEADIKPDPAVEARVAAYEAELGQALDREIGRSEVPLDASEPAVRIQETNVGDLVADALRAANGAEIAIMNGGGIRSNRVIPAGALTKRMVQAMFPFGNTVVKLEISGADLLTVLEHGLSAVAEAKGRFPQVSGISLTYAPGAPPGKRIRELLVGGEPLVAERRYTLATTDYLADGGDGFPALKEARRVVAANGGKLLVDVVVDHVSGMGKAVSLKPEGRVRSLAE